MKNQILVLASILFLFFSCVENKKTASSVQQDPITFKTKIDSLFNTYEKSGDFMGSIALSYNGKTSYTNAIGFDDIETKKKSNTHTKYRIGSVSKTYTAVLIFKAIEEHKLSLDRTIENYFPKIENANKITIAQLLQHRSGIYNFTKDEDFFKFHTQYKSPEEMIEMISSYESDFEPNSTSDYSNSNYFLLAQILEKIYNVSYENLLQEKIWAPLQLENTYVGKKMSLTKNESYSYRYTTEFAKLPETDMSITLGAGSIVSNPSEVNKFMQALFTGAILSPQSLASMKTIKDDYGMGLARYKIHDRQGFGHRGTLDGYKTTAMYFPSEKLGITITSNGTKDNNINDIFLEVLKLYFNDPILEIEETEVQKYVGTYVSPEDKTTTFSFVQDKNALLLRIGDEIKEPLVYSGNNKFLFNQIYAASFTFVFSPDGNQVTAQYGDSEGFICVKE